ncbi:hypothetical protein CJF32_00010412 [Rutstroemia sp. NJR-2017a WRK4]|nr:hypothetical protein CJF32_00010412 [Rutstroemia sp. NJR-2017a WRK4]
MPACTVHLLSLTVPLPEFLNKLSTTSLKPLTVARVIRWIILPSTLSTDALLAQNIHWDVLLILPSTDALPSSLQPLIRHQWQITAGVPSRLIQDFSSKNQTLLHPSPDSIPPLTGSLHNPRIATSAQSLELSPPLRDWISTFRSHEGKHAMSMLNLLSFHPGKKDQYLQYGSAFAKSIGSKRGGVAKIVGTVIDDKNEGWDEIALAHYPSIDHFADMLASEDYQEVNHKYRVGSLRDTCILCTTEVDLVREEDGEGKGKAKL